MNMQEGFRCWSNMKADQGTITLLAESCCCVALDHIISWCRKAHHWNTNPLGYNLSWGVFCVMAFFSVSSQLKFMWLCPNGGVSRLAPREIHLCVMTIEEVKVQHSATVTGFSKQLL